MALCRIENLMAETGVQFGTSGVRGLVAQMTNEVCFAYVTAFLQTAATHASQVVVGHDLRPSSPRIAAVCAAAIESTGRKMIYAGALPTPALAYFAAQEKSPAVVVTGSHIPFDRNGIKFYRPEGEISKDDETAIRDASVDVPSRPRCASLPKPDSRASMMYVRRYLDFFGEGTLGGMRVAVYEHSSVARDLLRRILEGLGAQVIALGRTDTFVPIDTEAVRAEDIRQARQWALAHHFDALVSTDGDADRPLIADEQGQWLRGDVVGILCAQYIGARTVVTPVSSNTAVEQCGSFDQVLRTRIGSPHVIAEMQKAGRQGKEPVVGYEANGGFLLGNDIMCKGRKLKALPTRDALLPILALSAWSRERQCKLSALPLHLPSRYTASDRLQDFSATNSRTLLDRLHTVPGLLSMFLAPESGPITRIDRTDGLRVSFACGDIVHLRPSGNAPELRCYAEADTSAHARKLCEECLQRILTASPNPE